ncbi:hypothetical protein L0222_00715 [bacterium]|nr:hypothetical protein [bacterium]
MVLSSGVRLGPYEIVAPIGAGGMGEVYKALDTRLDRTVAIKVLPLHLSGNVELKQRFEREALVGLQLSGERKAFPYLQTEFNEGNAQFSPDGRWIAYLSDESGRIEVYLQSYPTPGSKLRISTDGAADQPQWRKDGKELYYVALDRKMMAVPLQGTSTLEAGNPQTLFQTQIKTRIEARNYYVATGDGQRFLVNTTLKEIATAPITIVLNWSAEMNKQPD